MAKSKDTYDFGVIATSKLAKVEIADKDYTEGDKRYFTWEEACAIEKKLNNGWRLPTRQEWVLICEEFACGEDGDLDARKLMSRLRLGLTGYVYPWSSNQQVRNVGANGYFWSSVASGASIARYLSVKPTHVYSSGGNIRDYGFSVRLVRDVKGEK